MGLLDELLTEGKKYLRDAMPGGLLNPEISNQSVLDGAAIASSPVPVIGDLLGLGADLHRYAKQPEERTAGNFALTGLGMLPVIPSMTAWHGSPHKFDKFSLDKIGTGEGAQAYGHGLYLAESPGVAGQYAENLARPSLKLSSGESVAISQRPTASQARYTNAPADPVMDTAANVLHSTNGDIGAALKRLDPFDDADAIDLLKHWQSNPTQIPQVDKGKYLYKTDIPDEAVARFLDWDKPLSQQSPEVRQALESHEAYPAIKKWVDSALSNAPPNTEATGQAINEVLADKLGGQAAVSSLLKKQGIPGIRYLDGGSRSAGQGSSNFVAFDPEMIRILERNGIPTGNKPWSPGEYNLGDLLK